MNGISEFTVDVIDQTFWQQYYLWMSGAWGNWLLTVLGVLVLAFVVSVLRGK